MRKDYIIAFILAFIAAYGLWPLLTYMWTFVANTEFVFEPMRNAVVAACIAAVVVFMKDSN